MISEPKIQTFDPARFERLVVISDIHGCFGSFGRLLERTEWGPSDALILTGDYVERGTGSLPLLRKIMELSAKDNVFVLAGNCDNLLEDAFDNRFRGDMLEYIRKKPRTVLSEMLEEQGIPRDESLTLDLLKEMILTGYSEERNFLLGLPHILDGGSHVFVHAGLKNATLSLNDPEDCVRMKDFCQDGECFPFLLSVGHVPVRRNREDGSDMPVFDDKRNIWFIDGGAGVFRDGHLNALILNKNGKTSVISEPADDGF